MSILGQNRARSSYAGRLQNLSQDAVTELPSLPDYKTAASQAMQGAASSYGSMTKNIPKPGPTATGALGALSSGVATGLQLHKFAVGAGAISGTAAGTAAAGTAAAGTAAAGTGVAATLAAVPGIGWAVGGLALLAYMFD